MISSFLSGMNWTVWVRNACVFDDYMLMGQWPEMLLCPGGLSDSWSVWGSKCCRCLCYEHKVQAFCFLWFLHLVSCFTGHWADCQTMTVMNITVVLAYRKICTVSLTLIFHCHVCSNTPSLVVHLIIARLRLQEF